MLLLAQQFLRRDWQVHYVTSDPVTGAPDGFAVHRVTGPPGSAALQQSLADTLDRLAPEVLYQRGRKWLTSHVARYARARRRKWLFAASMDIDCRYAKSAPRILEGGTSGWRTPLALYRALREDRRTLAGIRSASAVLVQNHRQQGAMERLLRRSCYLVRNICPPDGGRGAANEQGPPTVLWLANLKRWKRPEVFLELARRLQSTPCQLLMAGNLIDVEPYRELLSRTAREVANFRYVGGLSYAQSQEVFRDAQIFVNTSQRNEGFPNSFIHAWQAGAPVVSLEVDPDGAIAAAGLGMVSGSVEQLYQDVAMLVNDQALRCRLGGKAREFARTQFDPKRNTDRLIDIIRALP